MVKGGYLFACLRKWRKMSRQVLAAWTSYSNGDWKLITCMDEEEVIPKDVPKGHMVVYVGEEYKRYVIRVAFLEHPLFRALLERAREVYEFNSDSKLCIPCDENIFIAVLHYVSSQQSQRLWLCF
ncbi:putative small auxin-up RNA [Dioscorea sansibarensis]